MTTERIIAFVALASMCAFIATLGAFVREIDLIVVIVFGIALASYDFWRQVLGPKRD